jgi:PAS domain S-box-containing protein
MIAARSFGMATIVPPSAESARAAALDAAYAEDFDRVTRLAVRALNSAVAQFNVITDTEQLSVSSVGPAGWLGRRAVGLDASYCQHVVRSREPLLVENARTHPLVRENRATTESGIGAYAGVPVVLRDGTLVGTLCVVEFTPRRWTAEERAVLDDLAAAVADRIELARVATEHARARARLDHVLGASAVHLYVLSLETGEPTLRWASRSREEVAGRAPAELRDPGWWRERVHPDDRGTVAAAVDAVRARGTVAIEYRVRHRGGHYAWVHDELRLVRDDLGHPAEIIGAWVDISERKAAEDALRTAHAALEARVAERTAELTRANAELRRAQLEVAERLGQAAEFRDDDTGQHTRRVGELSARVAAALGLPPEEVELIRRAAPLHDVGKIGIPDAILLKPGRPTPEEYEVMKEHTRLGARLLSGGTSALMRTAEEIARAHHERWDGAGYPDGLARAAIPLPARVVAVADFFDALTSDRPYRPAWSREEALAHVARGAGAHFDPRVARALLDVAAAPSGAP